MIRPRLLLLACLTALAVLGLASSAHAVCFNASPLNGSQTDADLPPNAGGAPELGTWRIQLTRNCTLKITPGVAAAPLAPGDTIFVNLDLDGRTNTGNPDGMERAVGTVIGPGNRPSVPRLGRWAGDRFTFIGGPLLKSNGLGGFQASLDQLGILRSTTFRVRFGTLHVIPAAPPLTTTETPSSDFSPNANVQAIQVRLRFRTRACKVPRVTGLVLSRALSRLRAARCAPGIITEARSRRVRTGRVVSTRARAGSRTRGAVNLTVSRTRPSRDARIASAAAVELLLDRAAARL